MEEEKKEEEEKCCAQCWGFKIEKHKEPCLGCVNASNFERAQP